jgi:c(7)-type cytochrome triheme protein
VRKSLILIAVVVAFAAVALLAAGAMAVPPGKTVEFKDGAMGKVVFSGTVHGDAGVKCMECHPKLFPMKKQEKLEVPVPHKAGVLCFTCHNGEKAFSFEGNCAKCHQK